MFFVFEGHDGAGKSTQAKMFADYLRSKGKEVVEVRSPGSSPMAEALRKLALTGVDGQDVNTYTRFYMMQAAFAETWFTVILPALTAGKYVVADRWVMSSYLYQQVGEGMAHDFWLCNNFPFNYDLDIRRHVNTVRNAAQEKPEVPFSTIPDYTIRLLLDEDTRLARKAQRDGDMVLDSMESQGNAFERRIAEALDADEPWNRWCKSQIIIRQSPTDTIADIHDRIVDDYEGQADAGA